MDPTAPGARRNGRPESRQVLSGSGALPQPVISGTSPRPSPSLFYLAVWQPAR